MPSNQFNFEGLTAKEVLVSRKNSGSNKLNYQKENSVVQAFKRIVTDPMILLLLVAAGIYFISGKIGDGIFLSVAILFQTSISFYQYSRSKNALEKLKALSQPNCKVIRTNVIETIKSEEIVIGDYLIIEEGAAIPADGKIIQSNDFSVNESILTGESFAVFKNESKADKFVYNGTTVASGSAVAIVTAIGNSSKLGTIGSSLATIKEEKTPLELQIANFVKKMAIAGLIFFILVWVINYFHSKDILTSLLQSLTLAMSILPEEIPVAFTTFMALGAWRLMKKGIIVKQMKTVETLGSATVICIDKTGTITSNKMSFAKLFVVESNKIIEAKVEGDIIEKEVISLAMWASEIVPFDAMELAIHQFYQEKVKADERANFKMIHEYALSGKPPMMTHIFEDKSGKRIIAAKGAPEAFLEIVKLTSIELKQIKEAIQLLAKDGYRLLGVGEATFEGDNFPKNQQDLKFELKGIIAFYDPPKDNIAAVIKEFYKAGIKVKIITGDSAATTIAIAKQIGFKNSNHQISGDELMKLSDDELRKVVDTTHLFTRMFPEAKLRIINALKANAEIVAMTGDGVNDGPALKAAHIGIAMGKKGSEIAKQAASLILLNDDLSKMVIAIAMGRKIYANLKKAIQYIISIHIPILLIVFIPLVLGWVYPTIFSPIHIIFLEIIMGPTCSIIFENEPMEKNTMSQSPKALTTTFFNWRELSMSILQGLVISLGTLFVYQYAVNYSHSEATTRTMVFTTLIASNLFLTLINRSFYESIFTTLRYKNNLVLYIITITIISVSLLLFVKPINAFFEFELLKFSQLIFSIGIGFISVIWFEIVKWLKRIKAHRT
jgi:Ca2+-transporting ATPase